MGGTDSWHPNLDLQRGGPPPGIQAAPPPRKLRPKPGGRRKCEPCSPVTHVVLWGKSTLTPVRLPPGSSALGQPIQNTGPIFSPTPFIPPPRDVCRHLPGSTSKSWKII